MNWLKLPAERLAVFVTVFVSGAAAFYVFCFYDHTALNALLADQRLTYGTKALIVTLSVFALGWTVTAAWRSIFYAVAGAIGALVPLPATTLPVNEPQPWHNPSWRALLTQYLGPAAPKDIEPYPQWKSEMHLRAVEQFTTSPQRETEQAIIREKKNTADNNDFAWSDWYRRLHTKTLNSLDPLALVTTALTESFQAASVVLLVSRHYIPQIRHWWLTAAAIYWLSLAVVQLVNLVIETRNPWSSFDRQIAYLESRVAPSPHSSENRAHSATA